MISIDTNVLLRYLLEDDKPQAEKAATLILGDETVLITDVVLAETICALEGKRYSIGGTLCGNRNRTPIFQKN